tara:strand:- start:344 stop:724 length:381 start_codon:yes stop_codon:yes gene_type:complete
VNKTSDKVFEMMNRVKADSNIDISRSYNFRDSDIHGTGTFASRDIESKEKIGNAFYPKDKKMMRTKLGARVNHQFKNNSILKKDDETYNLYSTKGIKKGSEITANYKETPDFISKDTTGFKEKVEY